MIHDQPRTDTQYFLCYNFLNKLSDYLVKNWCWANSTALINHAENGTHLLSLINIKIYNFVFIII